MTFIVQSISFYLSIFLWRWLTFDLCRAIHCLLVDYFNLHGLFVCDMQIEHYTIIWLLIAKYIQLCEFQNYKHLCIIF